MKLRGVTALTLVIFFIEVTGITGNSNETKVTVDLYYEILCPDCIQFVKEQVCPVWKNIGKYFNVNFVPYGNAETHKDSSGKVTIHCQHGEDECKGNIMHACALKYFPIKSKTNFICCTMSQKNPTSAGPECAQKLGLEFDSVKTCSEGDEGFQLLKTNGDMTSKLVPPHEFVPWTLFNGIYNEEDMSHSQDDLLSVICKYMGHPTPRECNEI